MNFTFAAFIVWKENGGIAPATRRSASIVSNPTSRAEFAHLILNYDNLVYSCNRCNSWKREAIVLDPCSATLADHVRMDADGAMLGLSQDGTRLIAVLGLNDHIPLATRRRFMRLLRMFQDHPDDAEIRALYVDFFGYPDDLPNLARLRPETNSRPDGLAEAFFRQRAEGRLPEVYW